MYATSHKLRQQLQQHLPATANMDSSGHATRVTSLLDLSNELLLECNVVWKDSCAGVCRTLLEAIMACGRRNLSLRLGQPETHSTSRKSLLLLAQAFTLSGLKITVTKVPIPILKQLAALLAPPVDVMPTGTAWLASVTRLTLWGDKQVLLCLPQLLPDVIAAACPNLTEVSLSYVQLGTRQQQRVRQQPRQFARLQSLYITGCRVLMLPEDFQEQLQELHCLRRLALYGCKLHAGDMSAYCAGIASSVSAHLRWLCIEGGGITQLSTTALLSSHYPALDTLDLPRAVVDDDIMRLLLQHAPRLGTVVVNCFMLKTDYSSSSCAWQWVSMKLCYMAALPLLPVQPHLQLGVYGHIVLGNPKLQLVNTGNGPAADLQVTAAAVAVVQRCANVHFNGDLIIDIPPSAPQHMQQVLLATAPILQHSHWLRFSGVVVGRALLTALQHFQSITRICFAQHCTFEQGIWGSIIPLLAHVTDVCMYTPDIPVRQVIVMCAAANHKIQLWVQPDLHPAEWYEELQQGLLDVGHDLVTLLFR